MQQFENSRNTLKKSKEKLITAANNRNGNIKANRKITKTRKHKWEEKKLCGYFKR